MPRLAGRRRALIGALLLVIVVLPSAAWSQQPGGGTTRPGAVTPPPGGTAPGAPPPGSETTPTEPGPTAPVAPIAPVAPAVPQPVPVIPDPLLIPPLTIPSVPQRFLPPPTAAVAPSARYQLLYSFGISEEYTDNFNLTERKKQENFRSTVSPGLTLQVNAAFVKGQVGYTFSPSYDTATSEVSLFHSLIGQVTWDVTPLWRLTLADTLTRSDQTEQASSLQLRQQRQTFTSNVLSLTSDYQLDRVATRQSYLWSTFSDTGGQETTSHTIGLSATLPIYRTNSVSAGYEYLSSTTTSGGDAQGSTSTFGLSPARDSETIGHKFSASASRQINALRTVGVSASYALRSLTEDTGDSDFQVWNASVFHDYVPNSRLTLHATLGVSGVTTDSGQSAGPNLSTLSSLSYRFARAVLTVSIDKGVSETFGEGQNFGLVETEGAKASLLYPFTPLLSGTIDGYYRHNKQTGITDTTRTSSADEETKIWGGSLTLSWQVMRSLLLSLSYTYTKQTSDNATTQVGTVNPTTGLNAGNYTENRVKASLTLSF